jgi:hypothetical protein
MSGYLIVKSGLISPATCASSGGVSCQSTVSKARATSRLINTHAQLAHGRRTISTGNTNQDTALKTDLLTPH